MDFKENGFMYGIAAIVIFFVLFQSFFFLIRAWKNGEKAGLTKKDMKNAITSSALFTIAPAISIFATVITLASTLGIVLPWIRLTVVGNLQYEVTAAQAAMESFKDSDKIAVFGKEITDPEIFATVAWVMTIGVIISMILLPLFLKKIQGKIGKVSTSVSSSGNFGDIISASTFIGLISAFIGNALAGTAPTIKEGEKVVPVGMGAGVMSVSVLITSVVVLLILQTVSKKFKLEKFEPFIMPISMFAGMGMAILMKAVLPESISMFEWRPVK
ncbi:MAG: DUF5058 family protein [Ruminococcus sp.]|nr:DUF5058 family protein [Candidatus Copronaster equi]